MKINRFIFILLFLSLIACSVAPARTLTATAPILTATPVPASDTPLPPSPVPTTSVPPTATITVSPTPGYVEEANLTFQHLDILAELPADVEIPGRAVIKDIGLRKFDEVIFWYDFSTRQFTPIAHDQNANYTGYSLSPDGTLIGYHQRTYSSEGQLESLWFVIEDVGGNEITRIQPLDDNSWWVAYWLDNERLVINQGDGVPIIYSIDTGGKFTDSDWYSESPGGIMKNLKTWKVSAVFDKSLTRVVYIFEPDISFILWDLESKQVVVELKNPRFSGLPFGTPVWNSDDTQFVIALRTYKEGSNRHEELYLVSRDGEVKQVTFLGNTYQETEIGSFAWSPDYSKIAFFYRDNSADDPLAQFAILDVASGEVTNYCNLSGYTKWEYDPVWSPDSTKVLIERIEEDEETYHVVLFDTVNQYAAIIAENLLPEIWVNDYP